MDELISQVSARTGQSPDQVRPVAEAVIGELKNKLPGPAGGMIDQVLGSGSGFTGGATGQTAGVAGQAEGAAQQAQGGTSGWASQAEGEAQQQGEGEVQQAEGEAEQKSGGFLGRIFGGGNS